MKRTGKRIDVRNYELEPGDKHFGRNTRPGSPKQYFPRLYDAPNGFGGYRDRKVKL